MPRASRPTPSRPARQRLQKVLARAGVASRRAAEELIRAGRVRVDGRVAGIGDAVDPARERVTLDGAPLAPERHDYWLLNKPRGVITSVRDPEGRTTVLDFAPRRSGRLFPVGRLDRETEGLLLLTNDGELAQVMLHPSFEIEREYAVTVSGRVGAETLAALRDGVELEEGRTAPARTAAARFDAARDETRFRLILIEGRKRQIRRALSRLGHPVRRLVRLRMGPLQLGSLASGELRALGPREVAQLRALRDRRMPRARSARPAAAQPAAQHGVRR